MKIHHIGIVSKEKILQILFKTKKKFVYLIRFKIIKLFRIQ